MHLLRLPLVFSVFLSAMFAANPTTPPDPASRAPSTTPAVTTPAPAKKESAKSEWVFSLLPKSLQKNPRLELTVITEMTEAGKKLPPVSPDKPAYFETFSSGFHQLGHAPGNEKTLTQPQLEGFLTRSLASNGYLPAKPPGLPPSLLIIHTWGSHNLLVEGDSENPSLSGEQVARNLLDRAAMVGGEKFAREMLDLFSQADDLSNAANVHIAPGGEPVIGAAQMEFMNPVNLFKMRAPKNEFLVDQTANDIYYVVASAYDYQSAATNRKTLLWRTRMTVAAQGVSQEQTLPTLVLSAAPYFGKDMPEAEILSKRTMREGTVEVGTPIVVEPPPSPAEAQKKSGKK